MPLFCILGLSGMLITGAACLCLQKREGVIKKKREKGICCVADEEKGSPHVLLCLGLENRVFSNKHVKHPHILLK